MAFLDPRRPRSLFMKTRPPTVTQNSNRAQYPPVVSPTLLELRPESRSQSRPRTHPPSVPIVTEVQRARTPLQDTHMPRIPSLDGEDEGATGEPLIHDSATENIPLAFRPMQPGASIKSAESLLDQTIEASLPPPKHIAAMQAENRPSGQDENWEPVAGPKSSKYVTPRIQTMQ
jgi:hypothetical protein